MDISILFLFFFVDGVFGDEVKSVSAMEEDSVTLYTDINQIQNNDMILWTFGPENTRIAQINKAANKISVYDGAVGGRFKNRLKLNEQTGDLIITNITTQHTGIYQRQIITGNDVFTRRYSVSVTSHLPTPDITSNCTQKSSSCSFLCSVMNVKDVNLSWYKDNTLLSSIRLSDLDFRLSLSLEIEDEDNTYKCVVNNLISNQTQHLNINELCQTCLVRKSKGNDSSLHLTIMLGVFVGFLVIVGAVVIVVFKKCRKPDQHGQTSVGEQIPLNPLCDETRTERDEVKNITVKAGEPLKLETGVTNVETFNLIQWKFGELVDATNPCVPICRVNKNNTCLFSNGITRKLGNRLKLNNKTGSITIKNITTTDTGVYKLEINSRTEQICKSFFVTVTDSRTSNFCTSSKEDL